MPGVHESIVSQDIFDLVQSTLKKNSGRSETLHPRPEREYLLKGIIAAPTTECLCGHRRTKTATAITGSIPAPAPMPYALLRELQCPATFLTSR